MEDPGFYSHLNGFDNLSLLYEINNKKDSNHIRKILKKIGLDNYEKEKYKEYSLGMKQKLGIAAAVMEEPDIIILDEPINALDESSVANVRNILQEQKERGAIIIIACHDREELETLSDEIIEISEGMIIKR